MMSDSLTGKEGEEKKREEIRIERERETELKMIEAKHQGGVGEWRANLTPHISLSSRKVKLSRNQKSNF